MEIVFQSFTQVGNMTEHMEDRDCRTRETSSTQSHPAIWEDREVETGLR